MLQLLLPSISVHCLCTHCSCRKTAYWVKMLLVVRTQCMVVLNYSLKDIRNTYMKNPPFNSLVWGSLRLAPIKVLCLKTNKKHELPGTPLEALRAALISMARQTCAQAFNTSLDGLATRCIGVSAAMCAKSETGVTEIVTYAVCMCKQANKNGGKTNCEWFK